MSKTNPDRVMQFALKLSNDGLDRKAFNAAMRAKFPRITAYTLREARQNAKILCAIHCVTKNRKGTKHDDD